jgi:hypothetical protein
MPTKLKRKQQTKNWLSLGAILGLGLAFSKNVALPVTSPGADQVPYPGAVPVTYPLNEIVQIGFPSLSPISVIVPGWEGIPNPPGTPILDIASQSLINNILSRLPGSYNNWGGSGIPTPVPLDSVPGDVYPMIVILRDRGTLPAYLAWLLPWLTPENGFDPYYGGKVYAL